MEIHGLLIRAHGSLKNGFKFNISLVFYYFVPKASIVLFPCNYEKCTTKFLGIFLRYRGIYLKLKLPIVFNNRDIEIPWLALLKNYR